MWHTFRLIVLSWKTKNCYHSYFLYYYYYKSSSRKLKNIVNCMYFYGIFIYLPFLITLYSLNIIKSKISSTLFGLILINEPTAISSLLQQHVPTKAN